MPTVVRFQTTRATAGMDAPTRHGARFAKGFQEIAPVVVITIDRFPTIPPRHHVAEGRRRQEIQCGCRATYAFLWASQ
jgi:hypothetical protein